MIERFPKRKSTEVIADNEYVARLRNGGFTNEQVDAALHAHADEHAVGEAKFLNHYDNDEHVNEYKKILDGLGLHATETFTNDARVARRNLRFSRGTGAEGSKAAA